MSVQWTKKRTVIIALVLAALVLPLALVIVSGRSMWEQRQARQEAQTEFNQALRQSLERAADTVLPVPTLGDNALVVECRTTDLEAELQRVVRLAGGLGGSASSWNNGKSVRIVANVPRTAETIFRESVSRGVYDLNSAGDSGPMTVVEVLLKPKK
jgi:type II secretory pathway pseudopilin PulG